MPPLRPEPFKPTPAARIFPVWVARTDAEWQTFPKVGPGIAALYYTDEPFADAACGFNHDTWPVAYRADGLWGVEQVLASARARDNVEPLKDGLLREDFILHEVGGHHVLKVGGDHVSNNTLMNDRGSRFNKTEMDRHALRDVLLANVDAFQVVVGPPVF